MPNLKPFSDWSIRHKITGITLAISATALLILTLIFALVELSMSRERMRNQLTILAESIAQNSTAAISFLDQQSAAELLKALSADADITAGAIFTDSVTVFARYPEAASVPERTPAQPGHHFLLEHSGLSLELWHPIVQNETVIATLYIRSSLTRMKQQSLYVFLAMMLTFTLVLFLVVWTSRRLQRFITRPIVALADTMKTVTEQGTYTVRARGESEDEIGQLVSSFNAMLSVICARDSELQTHQQHLQQRVEQRTEELKQKHDEALRLAQVKSDFLAHMSHELRTPMNAIIGMGHLLKRTHLNQKQHSYLQTLHTASNLLLGNINNVLDFSKLEAGKVHLEMRSFQIPVLWSQLSSLLQAKAGSKGLDLRFPDTNAVTDTVLGDPMRLTQVLLNLTDNAIKFTDCGSIEVRIEVLIRNTDYLFVRFSVKDSGIGLQAAEIQQLFQPFSQMMTASRKQRSGGTGLGLAICKQLVTAMGGTIRVTSQPGSGSLFSFTVRLPTAASPEAMPSNQAVSVQETYAIPFKGAHILLVEDTAANRFVVQELLHLYGATVTTAETGAKALNLVEQQTFDLILMDIQLPDRDGCEVTRQIRRGTRCQSVPVIAMTAHALSGDRERLLSSGLDDYLAKPFNPEQLEQLLHTWLRAHSPAAHTDPLVPELGSPALCLPEGFNLTQGMESVDHNVQLYKKILQIFVEDYCRIDEPIRQALADQDTRETQRLLHSLVGASALIGWVKITGLAEGLQVRLTQQDQQLFQQQLQQLRAELDQVIPALSRLGYIDYSNTTL